jgi:hypothetical protein
VSSKTIPDRLQILLPNMAAYLKNVNKQPVEMWKGQLLKFIRFLQKLAPFIPKNVSQVPVMTIALINTVFCIHHYMTKLKEIKIRKFKRNTVFLLNFLIFISLSFVIMVYTNLEYKPNHFTQPLIQSN